MDHYDDEELDDIAINIIDQIKNQGKSLKNIEKEYPQLSPEEVDAFILKYGSMAIIDLSEALKDQAALVRTTGDSEQVIALSELANSFRGNLEVLQKRNIADNKNKTAIAIKQMDINSKLEIQDKEEQQRIAMSREEMFKLLLSKDSDNKKKKAKEDDNIIDI